MNKFTDNQEILFERKDNIVFLRFNRPSALNAINSNMVMAMDEALDYCAANDEIVAVIVEGEGRAFSAGGDVLSAYKASLHGSNYVDFFKAEYKYNLKLHNFTKPYICFYDGIVMGGGVGNSIFGKYTIATENTLWAMPESAIGFFTDVGASYFTQRVNLSLALFICLTGARLNAADCLNFGFATHYLASENITALKILLLENLKNMVWKEADKNKVFELIDKSLNQYSSDAGQPSLTSDKITLIENCFSAKSVQTIINNLSEQEEPGNKFAQELIQVFKTLSPLSLLVIFKHICETRTFSLYECLKQDYIVMYHMLNSHDFYEGVRAMLVDKDKNPKWQYSNINDIDYDTVLNYFKPIGAELYQ